MFKWIRKQLTNFVEKSDQKILQLEIEQIDEEIRALKEKSEASVQFYAWKFVRDIERFKRNNFLRGKRATIAAYIIGNNQADTSVWAEKIVDCLMRVSENEEKYRQENLAHAMLYFLSAVKDLDFKKRKPLIKKVTSYCVTLGLHDISSDWDRLLREQLDATPQEQREELVMETSIAELAAMQVLPLAWETDPREEFLIDLFAGKFTSGREYRMNGKNVIVANSKAAGLCMVFHRCNWPHVWTSQSQKKIDLAEAQPWLAENFPDIAAQISPA